MDLKNYRLILGSKSPRRSELLNRANLNFEIRTFDTEESYPDTLDLHDIAVYIAHKKAAAHKDSIRNDEIILTADTIVVFENKVYGKPQNSDAAVQTIMKLANNEHIVYTGVVLKSKNKEISFTTKSVVKFGMISQSQAQQYVNEFNPLDKAGAYGIQDWIGFARVESINGSYTNILGLPLSQTYDALLDFIKNE